MERLLNLLNEYEFVDTSVCEYLYNEEIKSIYLRTTLEDGEIDEQRVSDERIISKKFWFIKQLVDNDKIDFDKVSKKEIESRISIVMEGMFIETKWVLMLLSISDTPIDDLISYLK